MEWHRQYQYQYWENGVEEFPVAIEHFFQRGKTDLGFDQYKGRSWRGFHHLLVLSSVAAKNQGFSESLK